MRFDETASRRVAATYATPDVVEQRRAVRAMLRPRPGELVLDVGCGPGFLAREMAEEVGPTGSVRGIDPSEDMLAIARAQTAPGAPLDFGPGEATALPFPDGTFDVITATQVYEYVADLPTALAEARRVLRIGGRLLVLDTDWDSIVWHSPDPELTRRVLAVWDEHLVDPYLPRRLTGLLRRAGFTVTRRAVVPLFNAGYQAETYSAGLIEFISAFVTGRAGLTKTEVDTWGRELVDLGADYFFSLNRYVFLAAR
jgi:ubiquinone/menaquinone biosynthesis C-methylase UbiE